MTRVIMDSIIPENTIKIFDFENESGSTITLGLECSPQEYLLEHGDKVEVYIENEDGNLPLSINLSKDYLQIYPNTSWGNWFVFKNGNNITV